MKVKKKAWPDLFEKVKSGQKKFDVRLADTVLKEGDTLVLREWNPKTNKYTGRTLEKKVSFVITTEELQQFWSKKDVSKFGYQVIGFR
jgi:ASC-1-like (ASCH) protein